MDFSDLLTSLPNNWQGYAAFIIITCNLVTVCIKPPTAGSRWVLPYRLISALALNIDWATNHLKPRHSGNTAASVTSVKKPFQNVPTA